MKNQNSKFKHVLQEYDVESVEIHNYDLSAKLKDKIKREKSNNIAKDKESKMAKKSKTDTILEVVLNLKEEFNGFKIEFNELKTRVGNLENNFNEFKTEVKNDLNNFKIEVREEFSKVNSRLDKLEDDVNILKNDVNILKDDVNVLKQDVNSLKSEAIKHG